MQDVIVVSGATCSGKSALAVSIAKRLDGEIINLDSVQLYRGFEVGSAMPSLEEQGGVPHHLLGELDPRSPINLAEFLELADQKSREIQQRGKKVIFVGGSSLYITGLFHGLAAMPSGDVELRARLEERESGELWNELNELDPEKASLLSPNDKLRVVRALEARIISGEKASGLQSKHSFKNFIRSGVVLVPCWPRDLLYERINARAQFMLDCGLVEETRQLMEELGENRLFKALGYQQAKVYLEKDLDLDWLRDEISKETRRYAKRQMTFWRNEPKKRGWVCKPKDYLAAGSDDTNSKSKLKSFKPLDISFEELASYFQQRRPLENGTGAVEVIFCRAELCPPAH